MTNDEINLIENGQPGADILFNLYPVGTQERGITLTNDDNSAAGVLVPRRNVPDNKIKNSFLCRAPNKEYEIHIQPVENVRFMEQEEQQLPEEQDQEEEQGGLEEPQPLQKGSKKRPLEVPRKRVRPPKVRKGAPPKFKDNTIALVKYENHSLWPVYIIDLNCS